MLIAQLLLCNYYSLHASSLQKINNLHFMFTVLIKHCDMYTRSS